MKLPPSVLTKLALVVTTTFLLSYGLNANAAAEEQQDRKAIDELSQKDIAASMKDDSDTLCSLWTADGVLLMPGAPPLVGKKAICGMLQEQKSTRERLEDDRLHGRLGRSSYRR